MVGRGVEGIEGATAIEGRNAVDAVDAIDAVDAVETSLSMLADLDMDVLYTGDAPDTRAPQDDQQQRSLSVLSTDVNVPVNAQVSAVNTVAVASPNDSSHYDGANVVDGTYGVGGAGGAGDAGGAGGASGASGASGAGCGAQLEEVGGAAVGEMPPSSPSTGSMEDATELPGKSFVVREGGESPLRFVPAPGGNGYTTTSVVGAVDAEGGGGVGEGERCSKADDADDAEEKERKEGKESTRNEEEFIEKYGEPVDVEGKQQQQQQQQPQHEEKEGGMAGEVEGKDGGVADDVNGPDLGELSMESTRRGWGRVGDLNPLHTSSHGAHGATGATGANSATGAGEGGGAQGGGSPHGSSHSVNVSLPPLPFVTSRVGAGEGASMNPLDMTEEFEDELVARVAERLAEAELNQSDSPLSRELANLEDGFDVADDDQQGGGGDARMDSMLQQELERMNAELSMSGHFEHLAGERDGRGMGGAENAGRVAGAAGAAGVAGAEGVEGTEGAGERELEERWNNMVEENPEWINARIGEAVRLSWQGDGNDADMRMGGGDASSIQHSSAMGRSLDSRSRGGRVDGGAEGGGRSPGDQMWPRSHLSSPFTLEAAASAAAGAGAGAAAPAREEPDERLGRVLHEVFERQSHESSGGGSGKGGGGGRMGHTIPMPSLVPGFDDSAVRVSRSQEEARAVMAATSQLNGGQPQPEAQAQQLLNDLLVAPARVNDLLASSHDVDDVDDVNDVLEEVLDGMDSYDFLSLIIIIMFHYSSYVVWHLRL